MDAVLVLIVLAAFSWVLVALKLFGLLAFVIAFAGVLGGMELAGAFAKKGWRAVGYWLGIPLSLFGLACGWWLWVHQALVGTISQQYWVFAETSVWWWLPALLVALGGVGLGLHLSWKRLKTWFDRDQDD